MADAVQTALLIQQKAREMTDFIERQFAPLPPYARAIMFQAVAAQLEEPAAKSDPA